MSEMNQGKSPLETKQTTKIKEKKNTIENIKKRENTR